MAHARIAYGRGYILNRIVLMPYGAVLYGEEKMRNNDAVAIALAGPLFNIFIAVVFFAAWWLVPGIYVYTDTFVYANLSVALFNLIPIFPLDGSRVVLAAAKNKTKALKLLRVFGVCAAVLLFVFFIFSVFYGINITAGVMAVFLYYGAVSGTKKEMYVHLSECLFGSKNITNGAEKKTVYVSENIKLVKLLKMINPDSVTTFIIVDDSFNVKKTLEENRLEPLLLKYDGGKTVKDVINDILPS
jgi:stage IV sporulation protein FB